jgi:hypothetical protein
VLREALLHVREEVLLHARPRLVLRTEGHLHLQDVRLRVLRSGEVLRPRAMLLQGPVLL